MRFLPLTSQAGSRAIDRAGVSIERRCARIWGRYATSLVFLVVVVHLSACRSGPVVVEDGAPVRVRPLEARVDAIAGRTLVTPVALEVADAGDPDAPLTNRVLIQLADRATTIGTLFRVTPRVRAPGSDPRWLPLTRWWQVQPAGDFTVRDLQDQASLGPGFWVLAATPPPWAQRGDLRVGQSRFVMAWHESWRAPRREPARAIALRPRDVAFLRTLRGASLDVTKRWRLRLLADAPPPGAPAIGDILGVSLGHPVLDAMERQLTDRWRVALSRLDEADAATADAVFSALTRVAFDGEQAFPAWSPDEEGVANLLADMLDQGFPRDERARRAQQWLAESGMLVAWIDDDAGLRDEARQRVTVTTRSVWLGEESTSVRVRSGDVLGPLVVARPGAVVSAPVTVDERTGDPRLVVQAGERSVELLAITAPQTAEPPGLRMGPLFLEWEQETWLARETVPAAREWSTGALLYKEPARDDWTLYVECRTPEGFDPLSEQADVVRIWLGRTGSPASILRVTSAGRANDEVTKRDLSADVAFARRGDRWSAIVPIPKGAIDADSVLRIAIERIDPRNERTTYPRPLLPWDQEPGRMSVDLTGWNELR